MYGIDFKVNVNTDVNIIKTKRTIIIEISLSFLTSGCLRMNLSHKNINPMVDITATITATTNCINIKKQIIDVANIHKTNTKTNND